MFKHLSKFAAALALCLVLGRAANASTPFFAIDEFYSNADGSVQFILMNTVNSGALTGMTLAASNGSTTNSFMFPNDLPGNPINRSFLVGTQGLADLHLVDPDFIVPNGFLFIPNGVVTLGTNDFPYTGLPTDGIHALWGDADLDRIDFYPARAINFAGRSYTFTAPPRANFDYGGLWWSAAPGNESGWGIAAEHQGDIVFAAWATYDVDGSSVWFVMPRAVPYIVRPFDEGGGQNTYEGTIYRMSGPPFAAVPFDPSAVRATPIGTAGFHFDAAGDSMFYYQSFPGNALYKSITHQIYSSPVPVCVQGGAQASTPNFQGLWWNPSEPGWGLHLTHQGDIIFAVWFTYDAAGKATWLAMTAIKTAPNNYAGAIYRTRGPPFSAASFDPAAVTETQVGGGTLTFTDRDNGGFSYLVDGIAQTKSIARQRFADPPTVCN
jgi:hypothetical protein